MCVKTMTITSALACAYLSFFLFLDAGSSFADQKTVDVKKISGEEMKSLLDDPQTIIIDVRHERDWNRSTQKIKGVVHENPLAEEASWAGKYPKEKHIILY